jgi:hypothetical protein
MPTLLELQQAMHRSLILRDNQAAGAMLANNIAPDRLDIYWNTIISGLTKALRLSYPAVERLVGAEFFDGAAQVFIRDRPPGVAYLDMYGDKFPEFLHHFPPAASLAYLADVARLEWAVNCAIHAPDVEPLDLAKLAAIDSEDQGRVRFVAHPSVCLLSADHPVDRIWHAILARDDAELASLDINAGPIHLLVERRAAGVEVARLDQSAWRFLAALCGREPLHTAIEKVADLDAPAALAEHLAAGRFVAFDLAARETTITSRHIAA